MFGVKDSGSLPAITGAFYNIQSAHSNQASGAFKYYSWNNKQNTANGGDYWQEGYNDFDASRSSSKYWRTDNQVHAMAVYMNYIIKY